MNAVWKRGVVAAALAAIVVTSPALAHVPLDSQTISSPLSPDLVVLPGLTPTTVLTGQAALIGAHDPSAPLSINISLPIRNKPALDAFVATQASNGIYLTQDQFNAQFGATPQQVQAVEAWGAAHGLQTTYASADGLLITLQGTTAGVQSALGVRVNDYRRPDGATFFANANDPSVPAAFGIQSLDGLNSIPRFHTLSRAAVRSQLRTASLRSGGYFPSDFRTAYDVAGHNVDGTGQVIGLTLWGAPVSNTDLQNFATASGDPLMTGAVTSTPSGSGADTIDWVFTNGTSTATDAEVETAMDVEYSHGMAPHAHLVYYLGDDVGGGGGDVGLENGISRAANNTFGMHAVSNSWGGGESPGLTDSFTSITNSSFEHAAAVGITFYFSSGDNGTDSGNGNATGSYPADDPYVVSVGGTSLNTGTGFAYSSEGAWSGGGAGCSTVFPRTGGAPTYNPPYSYQANLPASATNQTPTCSSNRVEPDVSADADPNTGADVYYYNDGSVIGCPNGHGHCQIGGTSLAAPLWTGMAALVDAYAAANGRQRMGWANPVIYSVAGNATKYAGDFHDVTSGSSTGSVAYSARAGFDQATGWGSIDWYHFAQDAAGASTGPTATPTITNTPGGPTATNTPVPPTATFTNTPVPPTSTNTPTNSGGIINGGFDSGLSGWTTGGVSAPSSSTLQQHSGGASALLGATSAPEPNGASSLYQTLTVPSSGSPNLSFWYRPATTDSITYDWQEAQIRNTSGAMLAQVFKVCANTQAWTQVTYSLSAYLGQTIQIYFNVREDGYGDVTSMYLDDVSISGGSGAGPTNTNTPVPPSATVTNTPVPPTATRTNTPVVPTGTNTPTGSFTNPVVNGGFESGLSGWTSAGVSGAGVPVAGTYTAHSGSYSAGLGARTLGTGQTEPNGDNCLYQNESFSGSHTLTFYYRPFDISGDTITYDWQEAYYRASGASGCSESGTQLFKVESNSQAWTTVTHAVTGPGQVYFNVREDGYGDPSAMYVDDVSIQ